MARTSAQAVIDILGSDYDGVKSLTGYIATANSMTTRAGNYASSRGAAYDDAQLELLERWLAAYYYALSDKPYESRSTQTASGQFTGRHDKGFEANPYGQAALNLDSAGYLSSLTLRARAGAAWLGKNANAQTPYEQR